MVFHARVVLSLVLSLTTAFALSGCEEAAIGARCESVNDCDRTGSGTARGCYSFTDPSQPCSGSGQSCVCCPVAAMRVSGVTPAVCIARTGGTDSGVTVDSGVPTDSGIAANDAASSDVVGQDAASGD